MPAISHKHIVIVVLLLLSAIGGAVGDVSHSGWGTVHLQEGLLSVDVQDAPLADVLAFVAQLAKIPILLDAPVPHRLTLHFANLALDQGLRRLTQSVGLNVALLYAPSGLQEARVVPAGSSSAPDTPRAVEEPHGDSATSFPMGQSEEGVSDAHRLLRAFEALQQGQQDVPAGSSEDSARQLLNTMEELRRMQEQIEQSVRERRGQ
jgi:type II secretory pathway component GspD/PulD (secretin)